MRYNAKCTVWHKSNDKYITLHYDCWWQDTEAENIAKTGKTDVDKLFALMPVNAEITKGDYIAKGNIDYTVNGSVTGLLAAHKPLKVSAAERKFYGSRHMQHIKVTAG
ncbi:MAG: hypothetical protein IJ555_11130 [Ruminococcus sp.]|nr:hypothetical protein [Ruminococcus sp.]